MRNFDSVESFAAAVGEDLGASRWLTVTQEQIHLFADATGDHQWIHVDRERASQGPFGTTIAHGYLTLSLLPVLLHGIYSVDNVAMGLNYGLDRVRFPSPVPAGSRVRARARLHDTKATSIGTQFGIETTIECEGSTKPACVARVVYILAGTT